MSTDHLPSIVKSKKFENPIWNIAIDEVKSSLMVETRDATTRQIQVYVLDTTSMTLSPLTLEMEWWEKWIGMKENKLYTVRYEDQNDPTRHTFHSFHLINGERVEVDMLPELSSPTQEPELYEHGTEYHQMVASFLSVDLPLACEYHESSDQIIISYYLRSENGFNRYLLVIADEEKVFNILQDRGMKGFAIGAFFVYNDQLIFIKDGHEVCIYTL